MSVDVIHDAAGLVRYLCHQYAIPADHVYTHGDITGKTRCPGERFDFEQVRGTVR